MIKKCALFKNRVALIQLAGWGEQIFQTWVLDCTVHWLNAAAIAHLWGTGFGWARLLMVVQSIKENAEILYCSLAWEAELLEMAAVVGGANVLPRTCKKEVWDSAL